MVYVSGFSESRNNNLNVLIDNHYPENRLFMIGLHEEVRLLLQDSCDNRNVVNASCLN